MHPVRLLTIVGVIAVAGWWLFADTVAYHRGVGDDPSEIRFAHFGTYQDYQTWQLVITAFERRYPDLSVRQEYVVGPYGAYNTKLRQQMLSKTLPQAFLVQFGPFAHLAHQLADLTVLVDQPDTGLDLGAFDPTAVASFTHKDRIRGLPVSGGNLLIYCNPDCFERAARHRGQPVALPAPDWTIEQFRALAAELTCDFDGDGQLDQFGFWQPRWVYYLPFLWSFGAEVLDDAGRRWLLSGPEATTALQFYRDLRIGHRVSPRPDEVAQMFQDTGFLTGKTAMCINGPWFQPFLAGTKLAGRYHVAPIPNGPGGRVTRITWDGICMAQHQTPTQRENAWQFVRFVCSEEAQRLLAATQRALPALSAALPAFTQADGGQRSGAFVDALAYSRTQPVTPFFRPMDFAINRHLGRLLRPEGGLTADQCLADLAADPDIAKHFEMPTTPYRDP